MKLIVIGLLSPFAVALATTSHAAYEQYYTTGSNRLDAKQAVVIALKGSQVYKCTAVEAVPSKAGTSIGLRQVRKPKAGSQ